MSRSTSTSNTISWLWRIFSARFSVADLRKQIEGEIPVYVTGHRDIAHETACDLLAREPERRSEPLPPYVHLGECPARPNEWRIVKDCRIVLVCLDPVKVTESEVEEIKSLLPKAVPALWMLRTSERVPYLKRVDIEAWREKYELPAWMWYEKPEQLVEQLLEIAADKANAVAREFAQLRPARAQHIIRSTCKQQMVLAMASSLPSGIPVIGWFISGMAVAGETVFLTANQLKMCLTLSAIYGRPLEFFDRMSELWPVIGSAFGWRTVARGLMGVVPVVGPLAKASIAYAATSLIGEGARWFYERGRHITSEEQANLIEAARAEAVRAIIDLQSRIRRKS